ncbi:SA1002 family membrane protein [Staphylococcus chromogenes]
MLLSGIIQYIFLKFMSRKIMISDTLITILEYFIQWLLIYFTLYQFIANQLKGLSDIDVHQLFSNILSMDSINIFILPSLLVSWISISMVRMSRKQYQNSKKNES